MSTFELTAASTWAGRPVARTARDARPRARVVVRGTIRAVRTTSRAGTPAYVCTIDDGTGQVDLLFLGRRSVPGLAVGTRCGAEGTVQTEEGRPVLWNPAYRLEAPVPVPQRLPDAVTVPGRRKRRWTRPAGAAAPVSRS